MKGFIAIKYFSDAYRRTRLAVPGDSASRQGSQRSDMEALRQAHLDYLQKLKGQGKLFCGGPLTDWTFALDIYHAESKEEVQRLLDGDPYFQHGVFSRREIREWRQVF